MVPDYMTWGAKFTQKRWLDGRRLFATIKTSLQRFAPAHASIHNHFNFERHLYPRDGFKKNCSAALAEWRQPRAWCWRYGQIRRPIGIGLAASRLIVFLEQLRDRVCESIRIGCSGMTIRGSKGAETVEINAGPGLICLNDYP